MQSNDEAVFEIKRIPPADTNTQKGVAFDDDDLEFEKPSLFASLSRIFSRKKFDDDLDMDFSPLDEESTDFDDVEPKKSFVESVVSTFKKRSPDDEIDLEEISISKESLSEEEDDFDLDFPKPSFLERLFGRSHKKFDDEDDLLL